MSTSTSITKAVSDAISTAFAKAERPVMRVSELVAIGLRLPKVIEAQAKYLNGDSPNGNSLMDRKDVADILRAELARNGTPLPATLKTVVIARYVMKQQRRGGLEISRSGRLVLELPYKQEGASE